MLGVSNFTLIIFILSLLLQFPSPAGATEWTADDFSRFINGVIAKVDDRAKVLVSEPGGLRTLDLRERSESRELQNVERRIRTIEAMLGNSQDQYSITKEYVYSNADILLFGCFVNRAVAEMFPNDITKPLERNADTRTTSALCGLIDAATVLIPVGVARLNPTMRTVIDDAFSRRYVQVARVDGKIVRTMDAYRYPRSVFLARTAALGMGGFMALQQVLAWTYADEIDYRRAVGKLNPAGVTAELQRQIVIANSLNLELAAIRAAKVQIRQTSGESR